MKIILTFLLLHITHFTLFGQIDTLYISFNESKTNLQGHFNKTIEYKKHDSLSNLYEVQFKCFFNKIKLDSLASIEAKAINLGAYIRTQKFYFSYLISSPRVKINNAFVSYLLELNKIHSSQFYNDFDLYSKIPKDKISIMSNEEIYNVIKKEFDSLDKLKSSGFSYYKHIYGRNLEIKYYRNFKDYSQYMIHKEKLNASNFIDLDKPIDATEEFIKLFEKLNSAKVIYLTTTLNNKMNLTLFQEVYFNKQYIKFPKH